MKKRDLKPLSDAIYPVAGNGLLDRRLFLNTGLIFSTATVVSAA